MFPLMFVCNGVFSNCHTRVKCKINCQRIKVFTEIVMSSRRGDEGDQVCRVGDRSAQVAEARATLACVGMFSNYTGDVSDWKRQKFSEEDKHFDPELFDILKEFQQTRGIIPSGNIY